MKSEGDISTETDTTDEPGAIQAFVGLRKFVDYELENSSPFTAFTPEYLLERIADAVLEHLQLEGREQDAYRWWEYTTSIQMLGKSTNPKRKAVEHAYYCYGLILGRTGDTVGALVYTADLFQSEYATYESARRSLHRYRKTQARENGREPAPGTAPYFRLPSAGQLAEALERAGEAAARPGDPAHNHGYWLEHFSGEKLS